MCEILDGALEFYKITHKKPSIVYLGNKEAIDLYEKLKEIFHCPRLELFFNFPIKYEELDVVIVCKDSYMKFGI